LIRCLVSLFVYLTSFLVSSESRLSVSYVDHPAVNKTYQPIVEAMYEQANVNISLFKVSNSPRSVKALNDGFFDADIGKILSSIRHHKNIVYVPIPIAVVGLYLICREDVTCDKTVFDDEYNMIVSRFSKEMLTNIIPIKSDIAQILSQQKIDEMLRSGRVNYSLIADDINSGATNFQDEYKIFLASQEPYYHILHKRHADKIPRLEHALKIVLAKQSQ